MRSCQHNVDPLKPVFRRCHDENLTSALACVDKHAVSMVVINIQAFTYRSAVIAGNVLAMAPCLTA